MADFIKEATEKHKGAMTAAAKREGVSNSEYEQEHKHDSGKAGRRARLAITLGHLRPHAEGGVVDSGGGTREWLTSGPEPSEGYGHEGRPVLHNPAGRGFPSTQMGDAPGARLFSQDGNPSTHLGGRAGGVRDGWTTPGPSAIDDQNGLPGRRGGFASGAIIETTPGAPEFYSQDGLPGGEPYARGGIVRAQGGMVAPPIPNPNAFPSAGNPQGQFDQAPQSWGGAQGANPVPVGGGAGRLGGGAQPIGPARPMIPPRLSGGAARAGMASGGVVESGDVEDAEKETVRGAKKPSPLSFRRYRAQ
jgi:hypothetical protein